MPSFFEGFKRLMQGKPVFDPNDIPAEKHHPATENVPTPEVIVPGQAPLPAPGPKEFPMVTITRCMSRQENQGFSCELWIANHSQQEIKLVRVEMLGTRDELGSFVAPGAQREETLHFHARPHNTADNLAKLYFMTTGGDLFYAVHVMLFDQLADHTFMIRQVNFQPPIRDSY